MSKINILPISPSQPLTFWSYDKAVKYMGKKSVMPQTGLPTVLAMLPYDKFEIRPVIDLTFQDLSEKYFKGIDIVFVSSMIVNEDSQNEIIRFAHEHNVPVAVGGAFPTVYPERCQDADYIIQGEAEITLFPFLEDLINGKPKKIYSEKHVIQSGRNISNLLRNDKPDLGNTPVPRWDLLDLSKYYTIGIQYSRGCPKDCDFCNIPDLNGRIPRTKTPQAMIKELEALKSLGFSGDIFFLDDNLIGNKKNLREFLPILAEYRDETGFPRGIFTESSLDLSWPENEDILEMMVDAGINATFLGLESPDPDVLKYMNKTTNLKMSPLDSVRKIQRSGIEVMAGFIVGNDCDKPSIFDNMFSFIQEAGIRVPMVGLLTAGKGTPLYDRLKSEGRLREDTSGNNTHQLRFNFDPILDEDFLIDGYVDLQSKLFAAKNYFDRCKILQEDTKHIKNSVPTDYQGLLAFGKTILNHFFRNDGRQYAKYLSSTLKHNYSYLPRAVSHEIVREHFKEITDAMQDAHGFTKQTETYIEQFEQYLKNLSDDYFLTDKVSQIRKKANSILRNAETKYYELHDDFKQQAKASYDGLKEKIHDEMIQRGIELHPTSV